MFSVARYESVLVRGRDLGRFGRAGLAGSVAFNTVVGGSGADELHTGRFNFAIADPFDDVWAHPLFIFGRPRRRFWW